MAQRDADHRARASPLIPRTTPTCSRLPARRRRWRSPAFRQTRTIAGVRVGHVDGDFVINPTFEQRRRSTPRPDRRRQQGRHRDGRGGREGSARGADGGSARARACGDQGDRRRHRPARGAGRQDEAVAAEQKEISADLRKEVEGKVLVPLSDAMRIKDKLENYATVDKVIDEFVASLPDDEPARKAESKSIAKGLKEKVLRDEILDRGQRLDGRKFDEIRQITIEVGVLPRTHGSACSRAARPRRWSRRRSAPPTISRRSRPSTARRGSASCSTTTSRRSRSAR